MRWGGIAGQDGVGRPGAGAQGMAACGCSRHKRIRGAYLVGHCCVPQAEDGALQAEECAAACVWNDGGSAARMGGAGSRPRLRAPSSNIPGSLLPLCTHLCAHSTPICFHPPHGRLPLCQPPCFAPTSPPRPPTCVPLTRSWPSTTSPVREFWMSASCFCSCSFRARTWGPGRGRGGSNEKGCSPMGQPCQQKQSQEEAAQRSQSPSLCAPGSRSAHSTHPKRGKAG